MRCTAAVALGLLVSVACGCARRATGVKSAPAASEQATTMTTATSFKLTSPAFQDKARIPTRYTADGADVSPPLSWEAPPSTVSFALIVDDPDAPRGAFAHWVLYNLPATLTELPEDVPARETLPNLGGARQGVNDFGKIGYGGPAPPRGPAHRYRFALYALDAQLKAPARAGKAEVEKAMQGHLVGQARLTGVYGR